jgi:hypothetical protein
MQSLPPFDATRLDDGLLRPEPVHKSSSALTSRISGGPSARASLGRASRIPVTLRRFAGATRQVTLGHFFGIRPMPHPTRLPTMAMLDRIGRYDVARVVDRGRGTDRDDDDNYGETTAAELTRVALCRAYGVFLSALWVRAWPVAEISWPAPAVVWHALNRGAAPIRTTRVKASENCVRMMMILSHVPMGQCAMPASATVRRTPQINLSPPRTVCGRGTLTALLRDLGERRGSNRFGKYSEAQLIP